MQQRKKKFQVQKAVLDTTSKIRRVIDERVCNRHKAELGEPCYDVPFGICGQRAASIFTGTVSAFAGGTRKGAR